MSLANRPRSRLLPMKILVREIEIKFPAKKIHVFRQRLPNESAPSIWMFEARGFVSFRNNAPFRLVSFRFISVSRFGRSVLFCSFSFFLLIRFCVSFRFTLSDQHNFSALVSVFKIFSVSSFPLLFRHCSVESARVKCTSRCF